MSTAASQPINEAKLHDFVMKAVGEMGAAMNAALILVGDKLGLYKAMAGAGPMTSAELASKTGTTERYVREWLAAASRWRIRHLRRRDRKIHAASRAGDGSRRRDKPRFSSWLLSNRRGLREGRTEDYARHFAPEKAWAGTSTIMGFSPARSDSSARTIAHI